MKDARFVVIANPEHRRVQFFQAALAGIGKPPARVIGYLDLLAGQELPRDFTPRHLVRIESPGQNADVERLLILRGHQVHPALPPPDPAALAAMERGRILHPDWWYAGYADLLTQLETELSPQGAAWMNHPGEIAVMFDKTATHQRLAAAGVPVAPRLPPARRYAALREQMRAADTQRVFVKLRYSSSASGVVALQTAGRRVAAITSVEMVDVHGQLRLYNSRRIRRYENETEVARLIDALCASDVHIERWLPKAGFAQQAFDLRVVMIAGEPRHMVMRSSSSPMTNLHLGGRRGDLDQLLAAIPLDSRQAAWHSCRQAARAFPRSLYCGVDLMFTPGFRRHYVLEVNAFGDLLPGILSNNEDTYTAQLQAWLRTRAGDEVDL